MLTRLSDTNSTQAVQLGDCLFGLAGHVSLQSRPLNVLHEQPSMMDSKAKISNSNCKMAECWKEKLEHLVLN